MHPIVRLGFFAAILLNGSAYAGMIHKCKNAEGKLIYQEQPCKNETSEVSSWGNAGGAPLVIDQGSGGHYFVDGSINDIPLNFMVDTGATRIAIPSFMANRAGLSCQRQTVISTGNGATQACLTNITLLRFGKFTFRNIDALVAPNLQQPLLGMNILRQFKIDQEGDSLRLTYQ